jgi:hypothetical protein
VWGVSQRWGFRNGLQGRWGAWGAWGPRGPHSPLCAWQRALGAHIAGGSGPWGAQTAPASPHNCSQSDCGRGAIGGGQPPQAPPASAPAFAAPHMHAGAAQRTPRGAGRVLQTQPAADGAGCVMGDAPPPARPQRRPRPRPDHSSGHGSACCAPPALVRPIQAWREGDAKVGPAIASAALSPGSRSQGSGGGARRQWSPRQGLGRRRGDGQCNKSLIRWRWAVFSAWVLSGAQREVAGWRGVQMQCGGWNGTAGGAVVLFWPRRGQSDQKP